MLQNGRVVFDQVCDYQLLKKGHITCSFLVDYCFASASFSQLRFHFYLKFWEHPLLSIISTAFHFFCRFHSVSFFNEGHAVAHLVEALPYKPESSGFDSR